MTRTLSLTCKVCQAKTDDKAPKRDLAKLSRRLSGEQPRARSVPAEIGANCVVAPVSQGRRVPPLAEEGEEGCACFASLGAPCPSTASADDFSGLRARTEKDVVTAAEGGEAPAATEAPKIETTVDESKLDAAPAPVVQAETEAAAAAPVAAAETTETPAAPVEVSGRRLLYVAVSRADDIGPLRRLLRSRLPKPTRPRPKRPPPPLSSPRLLEAANSLLASRLHELYFCPRLCLIITLASLLRTFMRPSIPIVCLT